MPEYIHFQVIIIDSIVRLSLSLSLSLYKSHLRTSHSHRAFIVLNSSFSHAFSHYFFSESFNGQSKGHVSLYYGIEFNHLVGVLNLCLFLWSRAQLLFSRVSFGCYPDCSVTVNIHHIDYVLYRGRNDIPN